MSGLETIALIAGLAGTAVSAAGTLAAGAAAQESAEFEAKQREQQAKEARAIAQREGLERRREQRLIMSQQLARAAATGGASDPSVLDVFADTAEQGELNVQTEIYKGESRAKGLETAAEVRRFEGRQARQASFIEAGAGLLGGISTLYTRFGSSPRDKISPQQPRDSGFYYSVKR